MRRLAGLLVITTLAADEASVAVGLQSKDVQQRLAAVKTLAETGAPDAEELLRKALRDRDWEVVHRAVEALGVRGTPDTAEFLADFAISGPTRVIRHSAAESAKKLHVPTACAAVLRRLKGDEAVRAAEALAILADPASAKDLERLAKKKGKGTELARIAALDALGALADPARIAFFTEYLEDEDLSVRAAAVRALAATKDTSAIAPLRDGLNGGPITDVIVRRYIAAIRALIAGEVDAKKRDFAGQMVARSFGMGASPEATARMARLLGELGDAKSPLGPVEEYARLLASGGAGHADETVRRAAVHALGRIGKPESFDRLKAAAESDASARVRFQALRSAVRVKGDGAHALLLDRLAHDVDTNVREEAAAILGKRKVADAVPALVEALRDKQWEVCVASAVSLGKIRDPRAMTALVQLLADKDWRRRGGAVVGLGWIRQKEAIPHLLDMTRDKEIVVARTAVEFLRHISTEKLDDATKSWREWWQKSEATFAFRDRAADAKDAKRYGYAEQPRKVYEDMDIVVLVTRGGGDNIQDLLTMYKIEHRLIRAGGIVQCGLHPHALFVVNCPGEIVPSDEDPIRFYVHAGGYLFASCWSLTHTVHVCFPDVVRKYENRRQIVDSVLAEPVPSESPLTAGVFTPGCQPIYELMGSHLIEVLDPERFEVLIDSPDTATKWGEGNLAGWFTIGHGLVLDSANHFDLQGLSQAKNIADEKDRMAFAMDHLGYDYAELRELRDKGVFLKQPTSVRETRDQTIFRFITTFVRQKRIADEE
jgi:HEAT repeat protein